MSKTYFVYIMSNESAPALHGNSDLVARAFQHKKKCHEGSFTRRYRFDMFVYFEAPSNPNQAIARAKKGNQGLASEKKHGWS
jgi:putative endonuclease